MRKTITLIALLAAVLVGMSARTDRHFDAVEGKLAPSIELINDSDTLSLSSLRGNNVVLCFWSSEDAQSRINLHRLNALAQGENQFRLLAVNLDRSEGLFREIIGRDGFSNEMQFHLQGSKASAAIEAFRLRNADGKLAPKTFLIDPMGKITTVNPGKKEILKG